MEKTKYEECLQQSLSSLAARALAFANPALTACQWCTLSQPATPSEICLKNNKLITILCQENFGKSL